MASVNKVIVVGNLGRDPEVRYAPDGTAICNISVATTFSWRDKNSGERRDDTEWHRLVFYNRQAEVVGEYFKKGDPIYAEGRLKTRKYAGSDGIDRYSTEIIAKEFQFINPKRGDNQGGHAADAPDGSDQRRQRTSQPASDNMADMEDDIPF